VFLSLIGRGGFGKVHQVMKKDTKQIFALKSLSKKHLIDTNNVENTLAECDILRKIAHPFIVRLHSAFQTERKLYLVMDFVNGGHILFHLHREAIFSEAQARFFLAEVVLSIEHLHSRDIIHRDLKPENVLLDAEGHVVLTDFGFAKENVKAGDSAGSFCGTFEYMAPEVIAKNRYGKPADCWAIGILLYDMLRGHPPFQHDNDRQLFKKIMNDKLKLPNYWSPETCGLLRGLLQRDVNKRLTIPKIKAHSFFRKIDWEKMLRKEIAPPILPSLPKGIHDVSNFDVALTGEQNIDSETPITPLSGEFQAMFQGFSYSRSPALPLFPRSSPAVIPVGPI